MILCCRQVDLNIFRCLSHLPHFHHSLLLHYLTEILLLRFILAHFPIILLLPSIPNPLNPKAILLHSYFKNLFHLAVLIHPHPRLLFRFNLLHLLDFLCLIYPLPQIYQLYVFYLLLYPLLMLPIILLSLAPPVQIIIHLVLSFLSFLPITIHFLFHLLHHLLPTSYGLFNHQRHWILHHHLHLLYPYLCLQAFPSQLFQFFLQNLDPCQIHLCHFHLQVYFFPVTIIHLLPVLLISPLTFTLRTPFL